MQLFSEPPAGFAWKVVFYFPVTNSSNPHRLYYSLLLQEAVICFWMLSMEHLSLALLLWDHCFTCIILYHNRIAPPGVLPGGGGFLCKPEFLTLCS